MQTQIIFVLATFAYFASIVYIITPGLQPFTNNAAILLLCLGLSAGYAILTKTLNAGGLSYLALTVLYGTVFLGFIIIYSLFMVSNVSLPWTYETLVSQPTDIGSNTINTSISKYKNAASPTYTVQVSVKLANLNTSVGTLFERPGLLKVEILPNGQLNIATTDKTGAVTNTLFNTAFSTTQYVPYTFVVQPETINVYRDSKLVKSVKTPTKQPTNTDTTIIIGKVNGGSLDVFRFSDTNIL